LLAFKNYTSVPSFSNKILYKPNCFGIVFFRKEEENSSEEAGRMGRLTGMQKLRQLAMMGAAGTLAFRQMHLLNYFVFLAP
jgi:hypothetical protein